MTAAVGADVAVIGAGPAGVFAALRAARLGAMTSQLAVDALRNAIALRDPDATAIVHSDRGSSVHLTPRQREVLVLRVAVDCRRRRQPRPLGRRLGRCG